MRRSGRSISRVLLGLCLIGALSVNLLAQRPSPTPEEQESPTSGRRGFWEARLPGGNYLVKLSSIKAISTHQYLVDGVGQVSEVNISTDSSTLARFYVVDAYRPKTPSGIGQSAVNLLHEKGKAAADRVSGGATDDIVIKNYPTTTHAHTIEYRVADASTLAALYSNLERAWTRNRGDVYTPKGSEKE